MGCEGARNGLLLGIAAVLSVILAACGSSPASSAKDLKSVAVQATPEQVQQLVADAPNLQVVPGNVAPSLADAALDTGTAIAIDHGCTGSTGQTSVSIAACTFGDIHAKRDIVLYGDSHAAMWLPAFDQIGTSQGWKVILLWKGNCGAVTATYWLYSQNRTYTECSAWHRWAVPEINQLDPNLVVLTSSVEAGNGDSGNPDVTLVPSVWRGELERTLATIVSPSTVDIVLGDIPSIFKDGPGGGPTICLARHQTDVQACSGPISPGEYRSAEAQAAAVAGVRYINPVPWFCARICTGLVGNDLVYADGGHATATYVRLLTETLDAALAPELSER